MVFTRFPIPLKSITALELFLLIVFVIYIVLPIQTPSSLVNYIDNPLSYLAMFAITIYLFNYTTPLLGIIYIFVAYELITRSTKAKTDNVPVTYETGQHKKDVILAKMNTPTPVETTLEEEVIAQMAPTGTIEDEIPNVNSVQPNSATLVGASMF